MKKRLFSRVSNRNALLIIGFLCAIFFVQGQAIKGTISDDQGGVLPFAKVWLKNTSYGTISNGKGEYQLELKSKGDYDIRISSIGYNSFDTIITVDIDIVRFNAVLQSSVVELQEVTVTSDSKRKKGKKIMKEVISRRKGFLEAANRYKCETYCYTSLDKRTELKSDSTADSVALSQSKMNITEWKGTSYFEAKNRYKDVITGFIDYTDKVNNTMTASVSFGDEELGEQSSSVEVNPYIFISGINDADINIFKNIIAAPSISHRPIISPLAYNAFANYNFYLEGSFRENDHFVYEIRVEPIFKEEALFSGTLYIKSETYEPEGYELAVNKGAMNFFKEMRIICSYDNIDGRLLPSKREFIYLVTERYLGKPNVFIHGSSQVSHSNYEFEFDDSKRTFWLEQQVYVPEAFDRDSSYWENVRPFHLEVEEVEFIRVQDSISRYLMSEGYLTEQDSIYNTFTPWDFLFNGVGFRNTFKKQSFRISSLMDGFDLLGVGGMRQRFDFTYTKEFKNAHAIELFPQIDYGRTNKDIKGTFGIGYVYNPMKFSKLSFRIGDTYDFINGYQSIVGTFSPSNRVNNKLVEVNHQLEVLNGLYFRTGFEYSKRRAITNIEYPDWASEWGFYSEPIDFEDYTVFITELEFSYRIRQRYILKQNKKIITSDKWPILKLKYRKSFEGLLGSQTDFDFLEFGMYDQIELNSLGKSEVNVTAGTFLKKNNLRPIEHKYFRTSDYGFFSDPTRSMQRLDTILSTTESFFQANFIHHFNGFFLNKVWGINKLKLEETIGGGLLIIPESNYKLVEFYVGLERMFRIRKQLFKIGVYAVASDNNYNKANIHWKFGVNFYDSFRRKWSY